MEIFEDNINIAGQMHPSRIYAEPTQEARNDWRDQAGKDINPRFQPAAGSLREAWQDKLARGQEAVAGLSTKRQALLDLHVALTNKAYETMKIKNENYATLDDPFRNFRMFGLLGILVRMSDKLSRLRVFEENGFDNITDESIEDTLEDLINYCVLFGGLHAETK